MKEPRDPQIDAFTKYGRIEVPSVPRESSERGAEKVRRRGTHITQAVRILQALAELGAREGTDVYASRDDLLRAIPGLTVNAACGRLGLTKAWLIPDGYVRAREDAAQSNDKNCVTGYQISRAGVDLLLASGRIAA